MKFSETYDEAMQPRYGTTRWAHYYLGAPTGVSTPMQLQEITKLANTGMMNVEIGTLQPDVWEKIPKQHFEEARRLAELTGIKPSVHAPIVELSGFGQKGWEGEEARREAEDRMKDVVDKASELTIKGEPVPIVVHGGHFPSKTTTWDEKEKREIVESEVFVNPATGEVAPFKAEERFRPGEKEAIREIPEELARERNAAIWDSTLRGISDADKEIKIAMDKLGEIEYSIKPLEVAERAGVLPKEQEQRLKHLMQEREAWESRRHLFEHHFESAAATAFDNMVKALKAAEDKETLHKIQEKEKDIKKIKELQEQYREKIPGASKERQQELIQIYQELGRKEAERTFEIMSELKVTPPTLIPVEQFAQKEAAETIANIALYGWKKYKEKAPMICVENVYPEATLGRGETLKAALEAARDNFVKKAKEEGVSASEASAAAEKLIGATWDIAHINLLQKHGYDKKKIMEETSKIMKDLKHVHMTDNFGFSDAHLPPGMGNVPIEELTQELQKAGKLGKVRGIIEAATFPIDFKVDPHIPTLEYFQSPVYGWQTSPTWEETAGAYFFGSGGYFGGYGDTLPSRHWSEYGAGFSQLPTSLGGVTPGEKSKFAGTPMA